MNQIVNYKGRQYRIDKMIIEDLDVISSITNLPNFKKNAVDIKIDKFDCKIVILEKTPRLLMDGKLYNLI